MRAPDDSALASTTESTAIARACCSIDYTTKLVTDLTGMAYTSQMRDLQKLVLDTLLIVDKRQTPKSFLELQVGWSFS